MQDTILSLSEQQALAKRLDWQPFFQELADALLLLRDDRTKLLSHLREAYAAAQLTMPHPGDEEPADIDPFTLFSLLSYRGCEKRRALLAPAIKDAFGLKSAVPHCFTDPEFVSDHLPTGCPQCFPRHMYFVRDAEDIEAAWQLFAAALAFAAEPTVPAIAAAFARDFDAVVNVSGVKNNLPIGLYKLRPAFFAPFDKPLMQFVEATAAVKPIKKTARALFPPKGELTAANYVAFCENCREFVAASADYSSIIALVVGAKEHMEAEKLKNL